MNVVMLLCDSAQEAGGKLFVLGGGWNINRGGQPVTMGLAIKIGVPWMEANQRHRVHLQLLSEDGNPVPKEQPLVADGEIEVGRPPGVRPGTELNVPLALNFAGVPLSPGGYRFELLLDGTKVAEESFQVLSQPSPGTSAHEPGRL